MRIDKHSKGDNFLRDKIKNHEFDFMESAWNDMDKMLDQSPAGSALLSTNQQSGLYKVLKILIPIVILTIGLICFLFPKSNPTLSNTNSTINSATENTIQKETTQNNELTTETKSDSNTDTDEFSIGTNASGSSTSETSSMTTNQNTSGIDQSANIDQSTTISETKNTPVQQNNTTQQIPNTPKNSVYFNNIEVTNPSPLDTENIIPATVNPIESDKKQPVIQDVEEPIQNIENSNNKGIDIYANKFEENKVKALTAFAMLPANPLQPISQLDNLADRTLPIDFQEINIKKKRWHAGVFYGGSVSYLGAINSNGDDRTLDSSSFAISENLTTNPNIKQIGGVFVSYDLSNRWSIQLEANIRALNTRDYIASFSDTLVQPYGLDINSLETSTNRFTVFDLPLIAKYKLSRNLSIFGGIRYSYIHPIKDSGSYLSTGRSTGNNTVTDPNLLPTLVNEDVYSNIAVNEYQAAFNSIEPRGFIKHDLGIIAGLEYKFFRRFALDLRYNQGLRDITIDSWYRDAEKDLNSNLQLTLRYFIF